MNTPGEQKVIVQGQQWLTQGEPIYLVTVLHTWGSSPRPRGSIAIISSQGQIAGSVSGGCVEEDLIARLVTAGNDQRWPQAVLYGQQHSRVQLPCGASMRLMVERIEQPDHFEPLLRLYRGESVGILQRACDRLTGEVQWIEQSQLAVDLPAQLPALRGQLIYESDDIVRRVFGLRWRLVLFGYNPIARALARFGRETGYEVWLCDPRESYLREVEAAQFDYISSAMPDDVVRSIGNPETTAFVTLSHDPRVDDMALMEALETRAFYIAALGSTRTHAARLARLQQLGLTDAAIARLNGPAGLDIGSRLPEEIAVSIMAQLIQFKYRVSDRIAEQSGEAEVQ